MQRKIGNDGIDSPTNAPHHSLKPMAPIIITILGFRFKWIKGDKFKM